MAMQEQVPTLQTARRERKRVKRRTSSAPLTYQCPSNKVSSSALSSKSGKGHLDDRRDDDVA